MIERDAMQHLVDQGIDPKALRLLMEYGQRRGKLTRGELLDLLPDIEFNETLIAGVARAAAEAGIRYFEDLLEMREVLVDIAEDSQALREAAVLADEAAQINLDAVEVDDVLRLYLREAASVALLTAEEEVQLARQIEQGRAAQLEQQGAAHSAEQRARLERTIEMGHAARDRMIRANTRLVISVARRYVGHGLAMLDLIQEGNIGLMRAVRNFDYQRGFKFSTYATWWIRQAITRSLSDQSRTIRLPAYLSDQVGRMRRVQNELQQSLGRLPTMEEVAAVMELPSSRVAQILQSVRPPLSLEAPVGEEEEAELGDVIEDASALDPEESASEAMLNEEMRRLLNLLSPREQQVLRLRYGMGEEEPMTLNQVGQRLGITRERARQIEAQALERLRNPNRQRRRRGAA